jgi:bisphosphoglycerate-independent phosphoglycerate mutase (AlkP superfamily)
MSDLADWRLSSLASIPRVTKESPLLLIVLDGWGEGPDDEWNAVFVAKTPNMDKLKAGDPEFVVQ